ncbi:MAG: hypothetical protein U0984_04965 [Prosthecobacter sp.]|nr:hypothetical protein [Prosthecobacter sp.]
MLFSSVFMWLLIAVGFVVALPALWLLARALWPEAVAKQKEAASRGILKCFVLGLVPLIGGVIIITFISKIPKFGAIAVLVGGVILAWGFMGAAGIATLIGERLWPHLSISEPWRQTKHGGIVLMCCALLPVVGWAVLLPLIAIVGWGVNVRSWFLTTPAAANAPALGVADAPTA